MAFGDNLGKKDTTPAATRDPSQKWGVISTMPKMNVPLKLQERKTLESDALGLANEYENKRLMAYLKANSTDKDWLFKAFPVSRSFYQMLVQWIDDTAGCYHYGLNIWSGSVFSRKTGCLYKDRQCRQTKLLDICTIFVSDTFEWKLYVSRIQGGHQSMKIIGSGSSLLLMLLFETSNGGIYGPQQDKNVET